MAEAYSVTAGAVALTAATAKTVVEILTTSTQVARIIAFDVTFDASTAGVGVKVELIKFTTTGTGTAYTPLRYNGDGQNRASVTTAKVSDTAEPTTVTPVATYYIPNTGGLSYQWPLGREMYVPVSTGFGIRATAPAAVNVSVNLAFEE